MNAPLEQSHPTDDVTLDLASLMESLHDKKMLHLPLEAISVRDGFNPRRYFSDKELQELVSSIRAQGVIQPIIVKPSKDESTFHLVAGERRFRAASIAGIESIPAVVRLVSDEEALAMAVSENSERQDVSAAEEAKACQRMLALCKGDRTEAALALGWGDKKLESRLTLLHCTEAVLDALEQRRISIGHSELLAGLTSDLQDSTLPAVLEKKITVPALREQLGRYAYKLSDAVFDTAGCAGCPHNSSSTTDLFDESLSDGHCMNRDCYDDKTQSHLKAKKDELSEKYPVIWLDVERPEDTRCHLVREGQGGVGRDQYNACQGCGSFGALMHTAKGKEGQIEQGVCFDTGCNAKMVKAHQQELQQAQAPSTSTPDTDTPQAEKPAAASQTTSKPKKTAETPKRVKEHVQRAQYKAASHAVWQSTKMTKIMSLVALTDAVSHKRDTTKLEAGLKSFGAEKLLSMYSSHEKIALLHTLKDSELDMSISAFAATLAGGVKDNDLTLGEQTKLRTAHTILNLEAIDMRDHFIVDEDFLKTLTLGGLKALLNESGFIKWYDTQAGKAAGDCEKNILKGKRDDQIQNVLKAGFDWQGFVPQVAKLPES